MNGWLCMTSQAVFVFSEVPFTYFLDPQSFNLGRYQKRLRIKMKTNVEMPKTRKTILCRTCKSLMHEIVFIVL